MVTNSWKVLVTLRINFTKEIKTYLKDITKTTDTEHAVFVFKGDILYIVGYTGYMSEVLKLEITSDIWGIYRLHVDNIKTMLLYDAIEIVNSDVLSVFCYKGKQKICALRIPHEVEVDYAVNDIITNIEGLRGSMVLDTSIFKEYNKLLKLLEGGLIISNGFMFGEGDGFKVYNVANSRLSLAMSTDVVRKIIRLLGDSILAYDLGNKMVCEKRGIFYFTFNKFRVNKTLDTSFIKLFDPLFSIEIDTVIKDLVTSISSKNAVLTINAEKKALMVTSPNVNILTKVEFKECEVTAGGSVKLDINLLSTVLKCADFKTVKIVAYERFVIIKVGNIIFILKTIRSESDV